MDFSANIQSTFLNKRIYFFANGFNYLMLILATWLTSPYYAAMCSDGMTPVEKFRGSMAGYTIECIILVMAGGLINDLSIASCRRLVQQNEEAKKKAAEIYNRENSVDK